MLSPRSASRPRRGLRRRLADLARRAHLPLVAALIALAGALLAATPARAAGTVNIADRSPKEEDGRWKLKMTINYGGTPHLNHIPMIFSFTPTVLYERALTDQSPEKPVLNRIPLQGQQSINEDMDVGFSDGSGKVFNITKFDFVIRRDRGFEAGEYDLKITRKTDGAQMGQTFKITLQGDNTVIDRRAIVFSGEKKKKTDEKKEEKAEEKTEEKSEPEATSPHDTPPDIPQSDAPPPVEPKQGGCGCRVAGDAGDTSDERGERTGAAALAAAGLLAIAARRRRRAA